MLRCEVSDLWSLLLRVRNLDRNRRCTTRRALRRWESTIDAIARYRLHTWELMYIEIGSEMRRTEIWSIVKNLQLVRLDDQSAWFRCGSEVSNENKAAGKASPERQEGITYAGVDIWDLSNSLVSGSSVQILHENDRQVI